MDYNHLLRYERRNEERGGAPLFEGEKQALCDDDLHFAREERFARDSNPYEDKDLNRDLNRF